MAIKMDGHTITALQLKASDGSEVTKQLTEEGTIPTPTGSLSITANGTYDVIDKASAVVNVPAPEINLQTKTATTNGDVVADEGYDGLSKVIVNVSGDVPTLITKSISANGTYNASADDADGYSSVTVNVPTPSPTLQDKTITENGTYSADEGYNGLGEVVVNVSGGGAPAPLNELAAGTFTLDEDVTTLTINHGLSNLKGIIVYCTNCGSRDKVSAHITATVTHMFYLVYAGVRNTMVGAHNDVTTNGNTAATAITDGKGTGNTFKSFGTLPYQTTNSAGEVVTAQYNWIAWG